MFLYVSRCMLQSSSPHEGTSHCHIRFRFVPSPLSNHHRRALRTIPCRPEARGVHPTSGADHVEPGSPPLVEEDEANHCTVASFRKPQHRGRAPTLRRGGPIHPNTFPNVGHFGSGRACHAIGGTSTARPGTRVLHRSVLPLGRPRPRATAAAMQAA